MAFVSHKGTKPQRDYSEILTFRYRLQDRTNLMLVRVREKIIKKINIL